MGQSRAKQFPSHLHPQNSIPSPLSLSPSSSPSSDEAQETLLGRSATSALTVLYSYHLVVSRSMKNAFRI